MRESDEESSRSEWMLWIQLVALTVVISLAITSLLILGAVLLSVLTVALE